MTELAAVAAEKGIELRWRIDPRLPPCVRGPAQATGRILGSLTGHFVALCAAASIRVALDTIDRAADRVTVQLRIDIDGTAPQSQPDEGRAAWQQEALTIGVVTRLAALMGGEVSIEGGPGPPCRFVVTLPLAVEPRAPEADLDLRGQEVLIVSGDEVFAGEVIGLLDRWHADARCVGDVDTAGVDHAGLASGVRPVVIVDGRDSPLTALAFAENLRRREAGAPLILFAGESSRIERLTEVDEPGLDCLLPMPLTERLLANAFRGLPLATRRVEDQNLEPRPTSGGNAEASGARITPIAAHPKFALEIGTTFDPKAVEALRRLGGGDAFLRELIDSFRDDAELLLQRLNNALAAADAAGFAQGVAELRRCAGHLGGRRICEMLPPPADVTEAELRGAGALLLQRLPAEIDRLIAALQGCLVAKQAQRS